jgi:hypothetical protein
MTSRLSRVERSGWKFTVTRSRTSIGALGVAGELGAATVGVVGTAYGQNAGAAHLQVLASRPIKGDHGDDGTGVDAIALAALLEIHAAEIAHLDARRVPRQAVESCWALLRKTMANPRTRRTRCR